MVCLQLKKMTQGGVAWVACVARAKKVNSLCFTFSHVNEPFKPLDGETKITNHMHTAICFYSPHEGTQPCMYRYVLTCRESTRILLTLHVLLARFCFKRRWWRHSCCSPPPASRKTKTAVSAATKKVTPGTAHSSRRRRNNGLLHLHPNAHGEQRTN